MYLGIDYGKKRIGLALGSEIPKPFLVLENDNLEENIKKIKEICEEHEVRKIVIGMPENLNAGSEQLISDIKKLANRLIEEIKIEIVFEPEAYTSAEAESFLKEHNIYDRDDKSKVDALAAALLLDQYINSRGEE